MLLETLERKGVHLSLDGGDLCFRVPGRLSSGQRQWLKNHKPELVAELKAREGTPEHVYYGFTLADLQAKAHPDEWAEVRDNLKALRVFALSLLEGRQMAACVTPERFTKLARCKGCGVVHVPATWPTERVKYELGLYAKQTWDECPTCPWCRQRNQGKDYPKPRPTDRDGKRWPRPIAWQGGG